MISFKLPELGEGVLEGEIVKILVKPGDSIKRDQPLMEVMTDKATVVIEATFVGKIDKVSIKEGDIVAIGAEILAFTAAQGAASSPDSASVPTETKSSTSAIAPAPSKPTTSPAATATQNSSIPVMAAPMVRKVAIEKGLDLSTVNGSGPHGRILIADLETSGAAHPASTSSPHKQTSTNAIEILALKGLRRVIAEKMTLSKFTAPHYTYVEEANLSKLVKIQGDVKNVYADEKIKITFLPFFIKAVIQGLKKFPYLNASIDTKKNEITLKKYYNIGVAVASPEGLIVPVIKNADQLTIKEISAEIGRLAEDARHGKSKLEDLKGGTFTITSIGSIGGAFATPILNYPEVAILGINKIVKKPIVEEDTIKIGHLSFISLSLDHRIVDGAVGALFMNEVVKYLQNPEMLLLESR